MTTSSICRALRNQGGTGEIEGDEEQKGRKKTRHPIAEIALFRKRLKEWIKTSTL
jgi:hypothetical protein